MCVSEFECTINFFCGSGVLLSVWSGYWVDWFRKPPSRGRLAEDCTTPSPKLWHRVCRKKRFNLFHGFCRTLSMNRISSSLAWFSSITSFCYYVLPCRNLSWSWQGPRDSDRFHGTATRRDGALHSHSFHPPVLRQHCRLPDIVFYTGEQATAGNRLKLKTLSDVSVISNIIFLAASACLHRAGPSFWGRWTLISLLDTISKTLTFPTCLTEQLL